MCVRVPEANIVFSYNSTRTGIVLHMYEHLCYGKHQCLLKFPELQSEYAQAGNVCPLN